MIGEGVVLRGVKHLQQSGRGVAAKIGSDLVQLVEQNHRVAAFDAAQRLDNAPGQRADIGAAVAANLGFITHAAQGDARKLPPQRIGHAPAQGGLAHTRRADQTKDGSFDLFAPLDHRQKFQQAVLDFCQSKVLFVEDALSLCQIDLVLCFFGPGQTQNPIQIMPRHPVFGRHRRHLLQPLQFLHGHFLGLGGKLGLVDLFTKHADFAGVGVGVTQFALNGTHLLPQKKIPLRFRDGSGHLGLNLGTERQNLMLAIEHGQQAGQTLLDRAGFEQCLPLLQAKVQVDRNQIGKVPGLFGIEGGDFYLLGQRGRELDDFLELALRIAHHGRQFDRVFGNVFEQLELGAEVGLGRGVLFDANAPEAFDQDAHRVVGEFQHLQHPRRAADFVHFVGKRVLRFGIALQHDAQQALAPDHVVNQPGALGSFNQQRRHHAGKDHDVGQAEDGQELRQGAGRNPGRRLRAAGSPQDTNKLGIGRRHGRAILQIRCRRP